MAAQDGILRVEKVRKSFGGLTAVNGVSFSIERNKITALIGPNGSGKTTLFNLVTSVLPPDDGLVWLDGQPITRLPAHRIAQHGMVRTFQITRVFGQMTLWENMLVVARQKTDVEARARAEELLHLVNLWDLRDKFAADTSYGQQKLLEFVRVLMLNPRVILLDEPFAGVNPTMAQTLVSLIRRLQAEGTTFLIIDHAMTIIMSLCERVLVLDYGELIADGSPVQVQSDTGVLEAYFGSKR